jgi:hypothetical protein
MALANDDDMTRAETGRSRMPMARMRRMKAEPYAPSRSRIK